MVRIDPIRLIGIFKSLDPKPHNDLKPSISPKKTLEKNISETARDRHALKSALIKKLCALKNSSGNFKEEAPYIAIQEIVLWEFGEQFLAHPEFTQIKNAIVESILSSSKLSKHMTKLVQELSEES